MYNKVLNFCFSRCRLCLCECLCECFCWLQWVLSPKYFNFPFPITLTMIHMGFSGAVAFLLVRVFKVMGFFSCWEYYAIVGVRSAFLTSRDGRLK